jgi:hypothetical protein
MVVVRGGSYRIADQVEDVASHQFSSNVFIMLLAGKLGLDVEISAPFRRYIPLRLSQVLQILTDILIPRMPRSVTLVEDHAILSSLGPWLHVENRPWASSEGWSSTSLQSVEPSQ